MRRYRLAEAEAILGEERHTIVYWEKETGLLQERKDESGRRCFTESDIELLLRIKHLVRDLRYTIQGAKEALLREASDESKAATRASAAMVRGPLIEALAILRARGQGISGEG
jgi:DNA-binding transcriptional MerR regulator